MNLNFARPFLSAVGVSALVLFLAGCPSKKAETDANNASAATNQAPQIDATPMSFDAAGSDSGKIAGLQTVTFDYDKSTLREESRKKLQGNADWMKSHASVNVQVEGHCDARGSLEYNLALGERRARSVKEYLVGLGVAESRLSVISYGKEKPVAQGDSEEALAKNRRANFLPLQ